MINSLINYNNSNITIKALIIIKINQFYIYWFCIKKSILIFQIGSTDIEPKIQYHNTTNNQ
jgi:hypothetical protein